MKSAAGSTVLLILLTVCCWAQPVPLSQFRVQVNGTTPQDFLMRQLQIENDPSARMEILNEYLKAFPNDPGIVWILDQKRRLHLKLGQDQEALAAAEQLLAFDPDLTIAFASLKLAEQKGEAVLNHWRDVVGKIALAGSVALPDSSPEVTARAGTAREILTYLEYLDYKELLAATPTRRPALCSRFLTNHPDTAYKREIQLMAFTDLLGTGHGKDAISFAESALETDPGNTDMLVATAEYYFRNKAEDRVLELSRQAIEILSASPEQVAGEKAGQPRRSALLTRASWMAGRIFADRGRFPEADQALRVALAGVGDSPSITAETLFYLGWVNYRMGRFNEAIRFNQRCVAMRSPYQAAAGRNLRVIESERGAR